MSRLSDSITRVLSLFYTKDYPSQLAAGGGGRWGSETLYEETVSLVLGYAL